ncbi:transcriptional regulator, ArsR family protein [Oceanicola granulosus HTCC2516]|uniref:Transcriptional regulator, ArsR family protein n=1 Tax=Oceanicola granulosus (strain ATCC BAA-861 / DSM 15982 / KCTC 12143 / HTCC2516) TaxID=314256 RepID=Q2CG44_OCEGH|nr:metalloregulator ArsR/SmtB family transcription factor [Oceanicola granulosus]EAR51685.1 transcriptional regulator, ArsR family protein [Oceanicola granulosus HTCC2516]
METTEAATLFAALSQPVRLSVLRALICAGPEGMTAGNIAAAQGAKANTMSSHLSVLSAAGLVQSVREGRHIRYSARPERIGEVLSFLIDDCCGGEPGRCYPRLAGHRDETTD